MTSEDIFCEEERGYSFEGEEREYCEGGGERIFSIRNIGRIRPFITEDACKTLVSSLVTSRLDYGNALFYCVNSDIVSKLQRVQNSAARLITRTKENEHITPVLVKLHWLPVHYRVQYKLIMYTFKALHGLEPVYLEELGLYGLDMKLMKTYGKVVKTYLGDFPSLLIADPDIIKTILVKDFSKAPNRFVSIKFKSELKHGLTVVEDDHWRFMRNTLPPTFSSGKMRKMNPLLRKKYEMLKVLKKETDEVNTIEFKEVFGRYTMDVTASFGFGMDTDSQTNPDNTFVKYAKELFSFRFTSLMLFIIFYLNCICLIFPNLDEILNYFNISPLNNRKLMDFFKSAVHQAIEMRDKGDKNRKDLLQLMLNAHKDTNKNEVEDEQSYEGDPEKWNKRGLTEYEVTGNAILSLFAGFDTTANTMTFMSHCLAINPEMQEKLINEIDSILGNELPTYDNILKVDYLDWVFSETLRFYPPAVRLNRKSKTEMDIAGYKIPKDIFLSFSIYAVHRDPDYWPDPDTYNPERYSLLAAARHEIDET
ncbi:cytochrome P450 3A6-like [Ostrea edulis]|uniref:cytochrome P450 3A6-like n=1 Tax=Ostrea edulis TaxID=37623 RepID=UPI0024AEEC53|nr:cytochrome P450 3A6-like [Ostrea edulis]